MALTPSIDDAFEDVTRSLEVRRLARSGEVDIPSLGNQPVWLFVGKLPH